MPTLRAAAAAVAASLALTTFLVSPSEARAYAVQPAGAPATSSAAGETSPSGADVSQVRRERSGEADWSTTASTASSTPGARGVSSTAPQSDSQATAALPGAMHALPAHRLLDTRTGLGARKGAVATGTSVSFQVAGREGVPTTGVGAVALTITAVSPTGAGFVTAYASGATVPTASSLNYATGDIAANLVVTRLSADGRVELRVGGSGSVQLLAEVVGWVDAGDATEPGAYVPLAPQRLLDTRNGTGAPKGIVAGGSTVTLPVGGRGGVPATGAGAVLLNVTATGGTAAGYLTVGPTLTGAVTTSSLNYSTGQVRANLVLVPLSDAGSVDVRVTSNGSVHAVADVVGWVRAGTPVADGTTTALAPSRLLDTRTDGGGQVANHGWAAVHATGVAGVPSSNVHAVLLNVTATRATAQGRVSVLPAVSNLPTGSQVQFTKGRNDANLVLAPVSPDGWTVLLVQSSGMVDLVADVVGYVTGPPVDNAGPGGVTSFAMTQPTRTSVTLTWQNPTDADFAGVTIRRVVDGAATGDLWEGSVVAETTGTSFTDTNLTPGTTYGYSLWAHDSFPNVSWPVMASPTTTPLTWGAPVRVAPFVGSPQTLSCVGTSWCLAGDASGQALTWNGSAWSAPKAAVAVAEGDEYGGFGSSSCVSTSFCVAVADHGGIVTYRSGVWSAVSRLKSSTGAAIPMMSVDCTSTSFCVAAGQAEGDSRGWVARFNGTSWSTATRLTGSVSRVDCVSTTFCMAVGQDMDAAGWAARWNGSTWTSTKIQPAGSSTYDVACTSTSFCMVTSGGGRSVRWNGSGWTTVGGLDPVNRFDGVRVSCTSSTFCLTVDTMASEWSRWNGSSWSRPARMGSIWGFAIECTGTTCLGVDSRGRYTRFNGTSWGSLATFDVTRGGIVDLSCGAVGSCLATDGRGKAYRWAGSTWGGAVSISARFDHAACAGSSWCLTTAPEQRTWRTLSGTTWSSDTSAAATPAGLGEPECPVAGWCVAFDSVGRVTTFNGSSWSTPTSVFSSPNAADWTDVDCLSKTFCMAVNGVSGYWSRWNGSTWSAPKDLASGTDRSAVVSCATTTMCVAVDEGGVSVRFDGSSWRPLSASQTYSLSTVVDLACPATTFCAGLLNDGSVASFNGASWNQAAQETGLYQVSGKPFDELRELECPSMYACVVAGQVKVVTSH
jgi:hypothetical protein